MTSYGSYLSARAIRVNSHQIETISNNLANVPTAGFKRALAEVIDVPAPGNLAGGELRRMGDKIGGGPAVRSTLFDLTQGPLTSSGNPLDVAVQGEGYFAVRLGPGDEGPVRLTRDGSFMLNPDGDLVTSRGHAVLDADGRRINLAGVPASDLTVGTDGQVKFFDQSLAQLAHVLPPDAAAVTPVGGNLFDAGLEKFADLRPAGDVGMVRGNMTESSNVAPETELIRLLDAQRQLEANAKFLQFQDDATGKLVNTVGRIA